jgi:hypothetical protein
MSHRVLKKIINGYLKKFAEPKLKQINGFDVSLEVYDVSKNRYKELVVFVDSEPMVRGENEKIIKNYVYQAIKFLGEDPVDARVYVDKRSLDTLHESVPYEETVGKNERIRLFSESVGDSELKWHQDNEDRLVTPLHETDWMVQLDDQLPIELKVGETILIPEGVWHRVIKGNGNLKVKVTFI